MQWARFDSVWFSLLNSRDAKNTYSIIFPYLIRCYTHPVGTDLSKIADDEKGWRGLHGICKDPSSSPDGYYKCRLSMTVTNPTWDLRFYDKENTGQGVSNVEIRFTDLEFIQPLAKDAKDAKGPTQLGAWVKNFRDVFKV